MLLWEMRDMPKANGRKLKYNAEYDTANYRTVAFQVRRDSGILDALEACVGERGISKSDYIRSALIEKIAQDEAIWSV